ncbi:MAG: hypothetical protein P1V20_25120 [Verrucomicrobiales bacterium]|nr:hypothetical protein [Verrucomicrobiales bacterium]
METITELFGWSTLLNAGLLVSSTIAIIAMRECITGFHSKLFGMQKTDVLNEYFRFLANYKILILIFNLVPYIALKIIET